MLSTGVLSLFILDGLPASVRLQVKPNVFHPEIILMHGNNCPFHFIWHEFCKSIFGASLVCLLDALRLKERRFEAFMEKQLQLSD